MTAQSDLRKAQADAELAKARLLSDAHRLQARLKPATLAGEAWDAVRARALTLADSTERAARKQPVAASAAAVGVIAFLARRPLARLIGRLRRPRPATTPRRARRRQGDDA